MKFHRGAAVLLTAAAIVFGACSNNSSSAAPSAAASTAPSAAASSAASAAPSAAASTAAKPVTLTWWHVQNSDPGLSLWATMAKEYMAAHPNVTIETTVLENDTFKPKLQSQLQGGTVPDLFQSWGGGGMAEQVKASLLKDITADVASWKDTMNPGAMGMYALDGKQYGIPFDLGMVGVWYNKDHFDKAGITAPPATFDELLTDVDKLKAAGYTPMAVGGSPATWTEMFWWAYLAIRTGGTEAMQKAIATGDWSGPSFVQAGKLLGDLVAKKPFQEGFLAAAWDGAGGEAATVAAEKASMMLMGQWAPGTMASTLPGNQKVKWNLGWFPFPAVTGGAGAPTDGFGGGNGFVVGKDAEPEAVDFLKYISSLENANRWGALNRGILPVTVGAESSVTDPDLTSVLAARAKANFVQLYLDQATTSELGGVINDSVATLFAGTGTPEKVTQAITSAAAGS